MARGPRSPPVRRAGRVPAALARAPVHPAVLRVLRALDRAGHRSWLVGGAVRDILLRLGGRRASDFDVATPATPREVTALFPKVIPTGVEHGTVTVVTSGVRVEVTTFRGEGAYADGRRPSSVTFHTSLEQDLSRRDFTMNALAYDPVGGEFRDPFGGRADIRRRLIRAVGSPAERFGEDGLRALRAVRFAAQLGYAIEPRTLAAIRPSLPVVRLVSAERVAEEVSKLLAAPRPGQGIALLARTGLLPVVFPVLAPLPARAIAHLVEVARRAPHEPPALRFAALLHRVPPLEAEQAMVALRLPNRLALEVAALLAERGCLASAPLHVRPRPPAEVRRWLSRVGSERARSLLALWRADAATLGRASRRREQAALRRLGTAAARALAERPPLAASDLAVDGRRVMEVLGVAPGRVVGEALRHLLDRVLDDPRLNRSGPLEAELAAWWGRRAEHADS